MTLGILCSGGLGEQTLEKLFENHVVNFVFTDLNSRGIIDFCKHNKLPVFIGNPRDGRAEDFIAEQECEILISINYLFLIEKDVINLGRELSFNIHGSLLPKYRGRTPHVWSIINGEKFTGITAHVIDEGCDTGDILEQIKIPIGEKDTGNDILHKYASKYLPLIEKILFNYKKGILKPKKQNSENATYFGKRVPTDGLINWNWQRQRVYNWIRAQAYPYPGAFTYYKGKKITIDEAEYSDFGFDYSIENGTVLSVSPLLIKTPNGVLEIISYREEVELKKGEILK